MRASSSRRRRSASARSRSASASGSSSGSSAARAGSGSTGAGTEARPGRPETAVGQRRRQVAGPHLLGGLGIGECGQQRVGDLVEDGAADALAAVGGQVVRLGGQRAHHLVALLGQAPQLGTGQARLRVPHRRAEVEQGGEVVGGLVGEQVHQPRGRRRLAQLPDRRGERLVAVLAGPRDQRAARGEEVLGRLGVELLGRLVQVHDPIVAEPLTSGHVGTYFQSRPESRKQLPPGGAVAAPQPPAVEDRPPGTRRTRPDRTGRRRHQRDRGTLVLGVVAALALSLVPPASADGAARGADRYVRATLAQMTQSQKIGQLFVTYAYGTDATTVSEADAAQNLALYGVRTPAEVVDTVRAGRRHLLRLVEQRPGTGPDRAPVQRAAARGRRPRRHARRPAAAGEHRPGDGRGGPGRPAGHAAAGEHGARGRSQHPRRPGRRRHHRAASCGRSASTPTTPPTPT